MVALRIALLVTLVVGACSDTADDSVVSSTIEPNADQCAHVIAATIRAGDGGFTVDATVSSADTGWDKYADAWEVRGPDGSVLGERVLAHPHETEQPFTRSLSGVDIPEDVVEITVLAHDSVLGYCGEAFTLEVPAQ
jgi:hypothetical protein